MFIKYDNKVLYEIIFFDKLKKGFPFKIFYLVPENIQKTVKDILIKEFTVNLKLFKFFDNNKIIINKYKVFLNLQNNNCFDVQTFINNNKIKKNEMYNEEEINQLKILDIDIIDVENYLKQIFIIHDKKEEINITIEDFTYNQLLLIKKLYIYNLLELLQKLNNELVYDNNFDIFYFKFRLLILIQIRIKKIKNIIQHIQKRIINERKK